MEARDIFEANSCSIKELLCVRGLGLNVPPYQRNYSWKKDDVNKLINDILHGLNKLLFSQDSFTFLGTIITIHDTNYVTVQPYVRPHLPAKILAIIDGQQRITTILMICIALHNRLSVLHKNFCKSENKLTHIDGLYVWLNELSQDVLRDLKEAFIEERSSGEKRHYPRMIRAFKDQWSTDKDKAIYNSPFSHLTRTYDELSDQTVEFKAEVRSSPEDGEKELVDRYNQITRHIKEITNCKYYVGDENESLPTLQSIIGNPQCQDSLLKYSLPDYISTAINDDSIIEKIRNNIIDLISTILFCKYFFDRVALTVVRGKDEDYAFTIFESLNTTGAPLTAFETFKPKVVSAETLENYGTSEAKKLVDEISAYFATGNNDQQQKITRDTIVSFALAETGKKLTTRLPEQRAYLRVEYEKYAEREDKNLFLTHLKDTTKFLQSCWQDTLPAFPAECSRILNDEAKLCLSFLCKLNHTVTIAPLVRYYSTANQDKSNEQGWINFGDALKAIAAFSILWRSAHGNTENIDQEYRQLMQGNGDTFAGLARSKQLYALSPDLLKKYLLERLTTKLSDSSGLKEKWVERAKQYIQYTSQKHIAKLIILAGYHDTIIDEANPGLVKRARRGTSAQLTFERWKDESSATLEHIAPQEQNNEWANIFYSDDMLLNSIGNLVLLPQSINSIVGNKDWNHKRIIYSAFAARDIDEGKRILSNAGIDISLTLANHNEASQHLPQLESLVLVDQWTPEIVYARCKRLLENAWDILYPWLDS